MKFPFAGSEAGGDARGDHLEKDRRSVVEPEHQRAQQNGNAEASTKLKLGDLELDRMTRRVMRNGKKIELTAREYRLLEFLMRSAGRNCGRMSIIEKVWDYHFDPGTNLVDVYIRRLREKIDAGFERKLLHTVRGSGYVLKETP